MNASVTSVGASLAQRGVTFAPQIAAAARQEGIDPYLLAAVAAQETGGPGSNAGRNVVGDGGHGRGLFQIDDRWHAFARSPAAMDPAKNAGYAARLLRSLLDRFGSVGRALSAYNAGSPNATGTITDWGDGQRLGYASSVMRHYRAIVAPGTGPTAPASTDDRPPSEIAAAERNATVSDVNALAACAFSLPPPPATPTSPPPSVSQASGAADDTFGQELAGAIDDD